MYSVSQKDLISSLWALSAKTQRVVRGTGGQSRGNDSCGEDGAGKLCPEARSPRRLPRRVPPGGAGAGPSRQLCPWPGVRGFPVCPSGCGWVAMRRSNLGGFGKGTARGETPSLEAENSVCPGPGLGRLLWANDQLGNLCQIRESRDKSLLSAYKNTTFTYLELPTPPSCGSRAGGAEPLRRQRRSYRCA